MHAAGQRYLILTGRTLVSLGMACVDGSPDEVRFRGNRGLAGHALAQPRHPRCIPAVTFLLHTCGGDDELTFPLALSEVFHCLRLGSVVVDVPHAPRSEQVGGGVEQRPVCRSALHERVGESSDGAFGGSPP